MNTNIELKHYFKQLEPELVDEMFEVCDIVDIEKGVELIKEGQYVKVVPIVLNGLVKVFTRQDEKEFLLYYIQSKESCIMSFSACLKREKSKIFAVTEENCKIVLIPSDKMLKWIVQYPTFGQLFYRLYDLRYSDLLLTINHLLFDKLDKRLLDYLSVKKNLIGKERIKISHKKIADELGTAREVITRLLRKLEDQYKIKQHSNGIEVL